MKKQISIITSIVCILVIIYSIYSCRKPSTHEDDATEINKESVKAYGKTSGDCECDDYINPKCDKECINSIMHGKSAETYEVNWTSCYSVDPNRNDGCKTGDNNVKSEIKFCYGKKTPTGNTVKECELYVELSGKVPPCIRECVTDWPYCAKMKVKCTPKGNDMIVEIADDDPIFTLDISYTIVGDPIINICCTPNSNTPNFESCCTGIF
jgi:hypothetical protein